MKQSLKLLAQSLYGRIKSSTHVERLAAARDLEISLQLEATRTTSRFIIDNCLSAEAFPDRFSLLSHALETSKDTAGDILEFGVHKGVSLRFLASHPSCASKSDVFGFDCLTGLPEDWPGCAKAGAFNLDARPIIGQNATFVEGLFQDTLPNFTKRYEKESQIRMIHIDSDLYSSCKYVLESLSPWIKNGTVIVFDEYFNYPGWQMGEHLAWQEFSKQRRFGFSYLGYNSKGWQLGIRIEEVPSP